jgi:hypothetical protein
MVFEKILKTLKGFDLEPSVQVCKEVATERKTFDESDRRGIR